MMQRIFTGWNLRRIIYLTGGILMAVYFFLNGYWPLGIAGLYFAGMGIFAFGCANGQCKVNSAD